MKPSEDKLERLLKKALKGDAVDPEQVFYHWRGLRARGDQKVIQLLNRQNSWEVFIKWISTTSAGKEQLRSLGERAGVPESANAMLREAGIQLSETDSPRLRGQWIVRVAENNMRAEWMPARAMLVSDPEVFEGILTLLGKGPSIIAFLGTLSHEALTEEQDRLVRKILYNLRQQGFEETDEEAKVESEIFALAENRVPLWQPLFYFRAHSAYTDLGDIFLIYITEGQSFEITDQKSNVRPTREAWSKLTNGYTEGLEKQIGMTIPFRDVPPAHARFLLNRTYSFLQNTPGGLRMADFMKFISNAEPDDPYVALEKQAASATPGASLLENSYFSAWLLDTPPVESFLKRIEETTQGPIILPEIEIRERQAAAEKKAVEEYFSGSKRQLWSFAFEKAAYYLLSHDSAAAVGAWAVAKALADETRSVDSIPQCAALFGKTVEYVRQQKKVEQEQEKKSSLIMSPEEFGKQYRKNEPPRRRS